MNNNAAGRWGISMNAVNEAVLDPLRFIGQSSLGWPSEHSRVMRCPQCDYEYLHPTAVLVDRGGDVVKVDAAGIDTYQRKSDARGVIIALHFVCESGHTSVLELQFHKGNTFISAFDPSEGVEPSAENWPITIWRD